MLLIILFKTSVEGMSVWASFIGGSYEVCSKVAHKIEESQVPIYKVLQ